MLIAGLSVVAALAFVLGLGVLCIWALKKWGSGRITGRRRVTMEVVQRVPLGPKSGLAVVRVGEKVMALSVGENGVQPLFELDEEDRQRVLATSTVATQIDSSTEAMAALSFGRRPRAAKSDATPVAGKALAKAFTKATTPAPAETPTPTPVAATEGEFQALLRMSLSPATKIAVFAGLLVLGGAVARPAQAQGQPPSADSVAKAAANAVSAITSDIAKSVTQAPIVIPRAADAPPIALPKGMQAPAPRAPVAPAVRQPALSGPLGAALGANASKPAPRAGNGADLTAQAAAAKRPTNDLKVTPAEEPNRGAKAATPAPIAADDAIMRMMPQMDVKLGGDEKDGGLRLSGTVGVVVMMGLLTLIPMLLLMMTGFTRILIVLQFLKQAMGTQSAPPGQLLAGMALLLTGFVMAPTLTEANRVAITPWLDGKMTQVEMLKTGVQPFRTFMLKQTRESDLRTFVELSKMPRPNTVDDVPLHVLMSAFVASELRTAFQIGFAIYLPFIIIDAVVASVLMSMGMFMLPPAMISLPFKLLLFVLVDGWSLTISSLVQSFK